MGLDLKAEEKSILTLFTGDKNQYIIPPYQRPYSWKKEQCQELFEDLKRAFEDKKIDGYFLGNIVIASSREDKNRLEVIDGQQRLTTLTLLLKALLFFDSKNKKLKNAIWELDDRTDEPKEQRLDTRVFEDTDSKFLKEALALELDLDTFKVVDKDNQYKKNIFYFYKKFKEFPEKILFEFSDFLLYKVSILPIQTQGDNKEIARRNAIKIFETINTKGISLSTSDILKAKIFSISLNYNNSNDFIKRWNSLYEKCENIKYTIDTIFNIYKLIIEVQKNIEIKDKELLDTFLREDFSPFFYKKDNEIMDDLFKIIDSIIFYQEVSINPSIYGELTKWFQILNAFNYTHIHALALFNCDFKENTEIILKFKKIIRYLLISRDDSIFEIRKNIINPIKQLTYDNIKSIENKKVLSILSFYLNPLQIPIYPIYIIDYSDDKKYFEEYFLLHSYPFMKLFDMDEVYIINDFKISYTSKIEILISELKKSKIEENNELAYKLELSKDDFQKFLKKKEKGEIERLEKFLKNSDEN